MLHLSVGEEWGVGAFVAAGVATRKGRSWGRDPSYWPRHREGPGLNVGQDPEVGVAQDLQHKEPVSKDHIKGGEDSPKEAASEVGPTACFSCPVPAHLYTASKVFRPQNICVSWCVLWYFLRWDSCLLGLGHTTEKKPVLFGTGFRVRRGCQSNSMVCTAQQVKITWRGIS